MTLLQKGLLVIVSLLLLLTFSFSINLNTSYADVNSLVQYTYHHKYKTNEYRQVYMLYNQLHHAGYSGKSCLAILAVVGYKTRDYYEYRFYHRNRPVGYFNVNKLTKNNILTYAHHWRLNPNNIVTQVNYLDSRGQANNRNGLKHCYKTVLNSSNWFIHRDLHQRIPRGFHNYVLYIEEWLEQW